jgi:hypothetical protein
LNVTYIGSDVQGFNDLTVMSGDLVQDETEVRFLTSDGVTLSYDYLHKAWSTFTNHQGIDADIWQGTYTYLRLDGKVYKQSTGFKDDQSEIKLRIGTAWFKFAGIQGYQRVRRFMILGNYFSSHIARVSIGYDYEPYFTDRMLFRAGDVINTTTWGSDDFWGDSEFWGDGADAVYQFRGHMPRQKCESVRFLIEDLATGTPGEGYSINDMALEVGIKRGLNKLRSSKTIG